jgi:hypothetical protein
MCFSAEVSFTAAAALTIVGIITLKLAKQKRLIPLALLPLFFAFQQFNEGILWLYLPTQPDSWMVFYSKHVFLFFAYLFWPIWLPFALTVAELNPTRKKWIALAFIAGLLQSAFFLTNPFGTPVSVTIVNHSIQYLPDSGLFRWVYVAIVTIPCFISSVRGIKVFGAAVFLAFAASEYAYSMNFVSVWCFFAALLSSIICWILWNECKCVNRNCKN